MDQYYLSWLFSRRGCWWARVALFSAFVLLPSVEAQEKSVDASPDRTLSPYFWVKPAGTTADGPEAGHADSLPLKSTRVEVVITGTFANVTVTQHYANAGGVPLEAIYVFPGSTRAAVHGLVLTIGEKKIVAEVKERMAARKSYEVAKHEGKTASLLEQQRPNVFQMNVANILPGDEVGVELHYTELLVPAENVYEFVFPAAVGPRYSNRSAETADDAHSWVSNPYLHKGDVDSVQFSLNCHLAAGVPLQQLVCPSHHCAIEFKNQDEASIHTDPTARADRDFVLHYTLAGPKMKSGLVVGKSENENFFLLTVQPPARVTPSLMPAREYDFVIDVSGSMNGFPLTVAKQLASDLLSHLRPQDSFNVILFSGASRVLSPRALPGTPDNIQAGLDLIHGEQGGGGTELLPALQQAFAIPQQENVARSFLLITDGYVDVEAEAFAWVREKLGQANLFVFGIGSSVNRHLMEGLARVGQGEPFIASDSEGAAEVAKRFREYISAPLLTHVRVSFEGFDAYDLDHSQMADVFAARPITMLGKFHGREKGRILVTGLAGNGPFRESIDLANATRAESGEGLARIWARARIAELGDLLDLAANDERKAQITTLGLTYNLLTRFTSFVAVDEQVRRAADRLETIKQPLPMPAGVEDSAVGGSVAAAPEPSSVALGAIGGLVLLFVGVRKWQRDRRQSSALSDRPIELSPTSPENKYK